MASRARYLRCGDHHNILEEGEAGTLAELDEKSLPPRGTLGLDQPEPGRVR